MGEYRTVDNERHVGVNEALDIAQEWLQNNHISYELKTVASSSICDSVTTQIRLKDANGNLISRASGKGLGKQSFASGIFEAIEHAASFYILSGQKQPSMRCVLPEESALSDGYMYRMCKKLAQGAAQPALVLQELRADFEIAWGSDTLYPRIPVDTATLLEKRDGKLLGVAGYATSTGVASGVTRADAILHALNEIIERDAESQFLLDLCMGRESFQKFELESKDHLYNLYQELLQDSGGAGGLYSLNCLAGYVFAAVYQKPDNEVLIGYGASAVPEIALERAVTELQQMKYAATISPGWEDEGGRPLSYLEKYPGMLQIAEHKFNWPQLKPIKFNDLKTNGDPQVNENLTHLLAAGINPWVREIYASRQEASGIFVEQVVLPDAECLFALVFGHPVMPVARLRNRENIHYLLTGEV